MVKITITENEANQRLDRFLRKYFKRASLNSIYKMIRKDVKLNGKRAKEDTMLCFGDELTLYMSEDKLEELSKPLEKKTAKRQFKIAYEDDNIVIVDKPWGLLTHGDSFEKKNTLANQVCGYLQGKGDYDPAGERTFTPSPVNRLDRNTSGLVIFGKNAKTLRAFTKLIRERGTIEKYYLTIVSGRLTEELTLTDRLAKDSSTNTVGIADSGEGKDALTYVRPVKAGDKFSVVEINLVTGRTHQIRAHLAHAGFPPVGDAKYGNRQVNYKLKKLGVTTQLLHAYKLKFGKMPDDFKELTGKIIEAPLPEEFLRVREALLKNAK